MDALLNATLPVHALQAAQAPLPWWGWPLIIIVLLLAVLLCWWPWGKKKIDATSVAPDVKMADVDWPRVETPKVELPRVTVPDVELPKVTVPDVELPKVTVPDVELPKVAVPEVELPEVSLPDVELPKVTVPEVELPEVSFPEVELPGVRAPEIDLPEVATPELAFSEVKVSEEVRLDDLKVIEGIGPKIAAVLAEAGIVTFSQLAGTSIERLHQILDRPNLSLADPTTWGEQARLAAVGDWDALKNLQDQLKAGRLD